MSVRDDPVLFLQQGKGTTAGGTAMGGNAITTTRRHKLDGPEHSAADDTTDLDATVDEHGLLPKLSGDPDDALRGDGTWSPVSGSGLPWFIVTDAAYGATGDGTTDDTAAINLAIAALNAATKGVLYFPAGTYKVTTALTTITASGTILGDGMGAYSSTGSAVFETSSVINFTSGTGVLFTVTGGAAFHGISLVKTGSAPSAGSAIKVSGTDYRQHVTLDHVFVSGFYDAIDVQTNSVFTMTACSVWNPIHYGVKIQNTVETDAGGASIIGCTIVSESQAATAGIFIASSGGNKIVSTNINNVGTYGIQLTAAAGSSILLVSACSIENYTGDAIHLDGNGNVYRFVTVSTCEFGQYGNGTGHAFYSTDIDDIIVTDCNLVADTGTPTAVSLNNGTKAVVGPFTNEGFSTLLASSSFTSIDDRTTASGVSYATPAIALGTAAAAGAASTAIRSDSTIVAFDATAPVTQAFGDSAATGSAAFAAHRDHRHGMPASPSASGGHILITDVPAGSPLVFADLLQNDDGTDLLYADA